MWSEWRPEVQSWPRAGDAPRRPEPYLPGRHGGRERALRYRTRLAGLGAEVGGRQETRLTD